MRMLEAQRYMGKVCRQHFHAEHLEGLVRDRNFLDDLQQKHPLQDQIFVALVMGD